MKNIILCLVAIFSLPLISCGNCSEEQPKEDTITAVMSFDYSKVGDIIWQDSLGLYVEYYFDKSCPNESVTNIDANEVKDQLIADQDYFESHDIELADFIFYLRNKYVILESNGVYRLAMYGC